MSESRSRRWYQSVSAQFLLNLTPIVLLMGIMATTLLWTHQTTEAILIVEDETRDQFHDLVTAYDKGMDWFGEVARCHTDACSPADLDAARVNFLVAVDATVESTREEGEAAEEHTDEFEDDDEDELGVAKARAEAIREFVSSVTVNSLDDSGSLSLADVTSEFHGVVRLPLRAGFEHEREELHEIEAALDGHLNMVTAVSLWTIVFCVPLIVFGVGRAARAVVQPLTELRNAAFKLGAGQLDTRVETVRNDEFGDLTDTFNLMAEQLEDHQLKMEETTAARERLYAMQREFLSVVTHELRAPLNSIVGFIQLTLMRDGERLSEQGRKNMDVMKLSAERMRESINDVLDLAKLEAGHLEVYADGFDLRALLQEVVDAGGALAFGRALDVVLEAEVELGELVSDETRVRQILLNFVSNAVKFTPAGRVTVRAKRLSSTRVEIAVQDTGVGISPEQHATIFEAFRQIREVGDHSGSGGGTGLGLAIVSNLMPLLGAELRVESAVGEGSTFTVTFLDLEPSTPGELSEDEEFWDIAA